MLFVGVTGRQHSFLWILKTNIFLYKINKCSKKPYLYTYVDRVAKGQTHIFFVRRVEEPDTPYFTMEYNKGRVIQCRGSHNCEMPSSVKTFVAAFEKLMKEREEKIERKCG